MLVGGSIAGIIWIIFAPYRTVDILIANGTVIDGSGGPPRVCDIGIRNGKERLAFSRWRYYFTPAKTYIDATGLVVARGLIQHSHAPPVEANIPSAGAFRADNFLRQGVTTIITGNCGRSDPDIPKLYFQVLAPNGTYINATTLVGHNSVRQQAMGMASRPFHALGLPDNEGCDRPCDERWGGAGSHLVWSTFPDVSLILQRSWRWQELRVFTIKHMPHTFVTKDLKESKQFRESFEPFSAPAGTATQICSFQKRWSTSVTHDNPTAGFVGRSSRSGADS